MDYQCKPLKNGRSYKVTVPGSKSITNRALLLGALAEGKTLVRGVLFSEDSRVFMKALEEIGFSVKIDEEEKRSRDRKDLADVCRQARREMCMSEVQGRQPAF